MSDAERPPLTRVDRCIIWLPAAGRPDRELLDALARRSFTVATCRSAYAATGEVCTPRSPHGALALLLVDPANLAHVETVVAAVHRYAPRAVIWEFDSASRRVRAFTKVAAHAPVHTPATPAAPAVPASPAIEPKFGTPRADRAGPPRLKLAGEGPLPPARETADEPPLSAGQAAAVPVRQVLTDEELAMLLSSEPIRGNG